MSKREEFIKYVNELKENSNLEMNEEAKCYWEHILNSGEEKEKPAFTENGRIILNYMQNNPTPSCKKAKDIGEGLGISSRAVTGAIRKLVTDGYVEKIEGNPSTYTLTNKGIDFKGE